MRSMGNAVRIWMVVAADHTPPETAYGRSVRSVIPDADDGQTLHYRK
jgi:hypothetical protein